MTDYQHLRELAEQATPGPWKHENGHVDGPNYAEVITTGPVNCIAYCYGGSSTIEWEREVDAEFIAAANPQAVLALLDARDALVQQVANQAEEIALLRRGQGRAPAPAAAGPVPVALHEAHPIPDSTRPDGDESLLDKINRTPGGWQKFNRPAVYDPYADPTRED